MGGGGKRQSSPQSLRLHLVVFRVPLRVPLKGSLKGSIGVL